MLKLVLCQHPDLCNSAQRLRGDGCPAEVQSYEGGFLLHQQPPQVPKRQQSWRVLDGPHRAPSIRVKLKSNMAASQREPTETRRASGQPVEGEVRQVTEVRQVQLFQTTQCWPHLEADYDCSHFYDTIKKIKIFFKFLVWIVQIVYCPSPPTCCLCSSLERNAPDMKRLSRPLRSNLRREESRGSRASREASVMLLPGRARLSSLGPRQRPTWGGSNTKQEG